MAVCIELLKAEASVGSADALAFVVGTKAGAVVADLKDELTIFAAGAEMDFAALGVGFDAVADGVFDDGLEN